MRSTRDLFDLNGRVALVTGGGRGLGSQLARGLAEQGAHVAVASRKLADCEAYATRLSEEFGATAEGFELDVADEGSVRACFAAVEAELGFPEIVVNNAGTSWGAPAHELTADAWDRVMAANLRGAFFVSREAGARWIADGRPGVVLNVASVAGLKGSPPEVLDAVGYSASKAGLVGLTRDLAVKWARHGIRVNAIAPGFFRTDMTRAVLDRAGSAAERLVPLGRLGGEDDLVGVAAFLCSDAGAYVTGQVLGVDGGMTAM